MPSPPEQSSGEPLQTPIVEHGEDLELLDGLDDLPDDPRRKNLVSFRVDGTIRDVVRVLNREGLAVVVPELSQSVEIAGTFIDERIDVILEVMAATIGEGAGVFQREGYVYVGPPSNTDQNVEVFYVPSADASVWREVYQIAATETADIAAQGDMVVVRDDLEGLRRVRLFHNTISGARRQYALEVVFAELTRGDLDDLGVDLDAGGLATLQFGTDHEGDTFQATLGIDALFRTESSTTEGASVNNLRLLLVEGETVSVQIGDTVNVRERAVSNEGTVTDTGFNEFQTGVLLDVTARGLASGLIRLDVIPEISEVRELVDGLPTISTRRFTSTALLGDGGVAVLGGLDRRSASYGRSRLAGTGIPTRRTQRQDETSLYVFCRVTQIIDPVRVSPPPASPAGSLSAASRIDAAPSMSGGGG